MGKRDVLLGIALLGVVSAFLVMAPAAAQQFPAPGRTITTIVPFEAGGGTDLMARKLTAVMAKVLGVPVQVFNKPGASSQAGITEVARSKPDGYTLGWLIFPTSLAYLDPARQSAYQRKDLEPIGPAFLTPTAITVLAGSPYRSLKDLVDAAKAKPGALKAGTPGLLSTNHLANIGFQQAVGVKFAVVNFQGGAPQRTALLGGHIDVGFLGINEALPDLESKGGTLRVLGVMSDQEKPYGLPSVKSQGFNVPAFAPDVGLAGPAGIPKDVVTILSDALRKAADDSDVKASAASMGNILYYLSPADYAAHWNEADAKFKPLIDLAKQQAK